MFLLWPWGCSLSYQTSLATGGKKREEADATNEGVEKMKDVHKLIILAWEVLERPAANLEPHTVGEKAQCPNKHVTVCEESIPTD